MNKKCLILVVLLLLVGSLLVACGSETDKPIVDNTSQEAPDQTEKEPVDKTEAEVVDVKKESLDIDYENMTEEDLVKELVMDINKVTVDEYLNLLESYKYAKNDNYEKFLSIPYGKTDKAIALLSKQNAVLPEKIEILERALKSSEPAVRGKILFDVSTSIGTDNNMMNMVLDLAKTEKDPYVLNQLAETFRYHMANTGVADFMFAMSKHENPIIRSTAIFGISSSKGLAGSLDRLIEMMDDKDESVSKTAYRMIGYLGDEAAVDPIVKVIMDPDKTDYHEDCMTSLVVLWLGNPFYDGTSEKAYNATIDYLKYTPISKNMPHFKAINYINGAKPKSTGNTKGFDEWEGKSTYFKPDDLVKPMFEIVKNTEIYYLSHEYAIELVNKYGTKEEFANLKPLLESSSHPEKVKILETYNKLVEKNK